MPHPLRRALALALLGALVLGGAGALLALRSYPLYEARLQVRVLADPVVGDEVAVVGSADEENFIATELVTLNGVALRDDVRSQTGLQDLEIEALQVGTSNVVEIIARTSDDAVVEAVEQVSERYVARRRDELLERILSIGAEVSRQLQVAAAEITRLSAQDTVTASIQRGAVTAEYTRLIEQRNTLQLASDASERLVQVVNPARGQGAEQIVSPVRDGALGAIAGTGLGLMSGLLLLRLRNRLGGLGDLLDLAPELALPTVPVVHGRITAEGAAAACASYVSALTPPRGEFGRPPVVVVAPHPGCGATFLAVGIALASARRQPTVLVAAGDVLDGAAAALLGVDAASPRALKGVATDYPGLTYVAAVPGTGPDALAALETRDLPSLLRRDGAAVVVDAPAMSTSAAAVDLAREAGHVLLVGGAERSTAAELDTASRALRRVGATLLGVVLGSPRRVLLPWPRRR